MTNLPPRVGMPRISNAAHKTLSTYPEYNNPASKLKIQPINNAAYEEAVAGYRAVKQEILPKLKELKQTLDEANSAYLRAYDNWNQVAAEYERIDRAERNLLHEQKMVLKNTKKPATKKSPDAEASAKKLAMKVLASLSPEKQAEILALIQAQASQKP